MGRESTERKAKRLRRYLDALKKSEMNLPGEHGRFSDKHNHITKERRRVSAIIATLGNQSVGE